MNTARERGRSMGQSQEQGSAAGPGYGTTLSVPSRESVEQAMITDYVRWLRDRLGVATTDYAHLWRWSVGKPADFWSSVWDYFDVLGHRDAGPVINGDHMPDVSWFPGCSVNYARNALRAARTSPDQAALVYRSEAGHAGSLSYGQLDWQVAVVRAALADLGVRRGDRVAAYLPNCPEALIGLLATASLGAVWTSCSPDFGSPAVVDRFAQVTPRVLIAADGYVYNGKAYDRRAQVAAVAAALPGLEAVITVDYLGTGWTGANGAGLNRAAGALPVRAVPWESLADGVPPGLATEFDEVPFGKLSSAGALRVAVKSQARSRWSAEAEALKIGCPLRVQRDLISRP